MRKQVIFFLVVSLLFNFYFLFQIISYSSTETTIINKVQDVDGELATFDPNDYFQKGYAYKPNLDKIYNHKAILSPIIFDQLINYSYQFSEDSTSIQRYYVNDLFPKLLNRHLSTSFDFEALNNLLNAAVKFRDAALYLPQNELVFTSFSQMIFEKVSENLTKTQSGNLSLSNRTDFQIVVNKCIENNYYPDLKESSTDKFLKTLLEKDYFHLINTGYQKSSIYQKITIGFMFLLMIMGFMYFINLIKK